MNLRQKVNATTISNQLDTDPGNGRKCQPISQSDDQTLNPRLTDIREYSKDQSRTTVKAQNNEQWTEELRLEE